MKLILRTLPLCIALGACGQKEQTSDTRSDEASADAGAEVVPYDKIVEPPQEYYDAALLENLANLHLAGSERPPVLYINFDGATLRKGYQADQSFILCSRQATIPAAGFSVTEEEDILLEVQKYFDRAGTNLQVVLDRPTEKPYTTIIVGGSYGDLGCMNSRGILGVAPLDRGNSNKNDIGFAFTRYTRSVRITSQTIAHEAGHSFGLDHINERKGLMYASINSSIQGFINGTVGFGRRQNAPAILQADVGKAKAGDIVEPIETIPSPEVPAEPIAPKNPIDVEEPKPNTPIANEPKLPNIPGIDQINGLGDIIAGLIPGSIGGGLDLDEILGNLPKLFPGSGGGLLPDLSSIGGLPGIDDLLGILGMVAQVPNDIVTNLPGGLGEVTDLVELIGTIGKSGLGGLDEVLNILPLPINGFNPGAILENIQGILNFGGLFGLQEANESNLPDLARVFALDQVKDLPTLLQTIELQAAYINQNFSGYERDVLLSALKVASAQAYAMQK